MALMEVKFFSEVLGKQTSMNVIVPQKSSNGEIGTQSGESGNKLKCLYLLHGLSDDNSIWMRRTSIERYAQEYGICVVMPDGNKSFYTNMIYGDKYYTHIAEELPRIVNEFFKVSTKREDNYIAGLSMGGYGALKIGLRNGDKFSHAAGLSAVADIEDLVKEWGRQFVPIFGENLKVSDEDNLFKLAAVHNNDELKPRLYLGIGTEDFLYGGNIAFREHIKTLNYDLTYRESQGTHCWEFWDEYIQYVLRWIFK